MPVQVHNAPDALYAYAGDTIVVLLWRRAKQPHYCRRTGRPRSHPASRAGRRKGHAAQRRFLLAAARGRRPGMMMTAVRQRPLTGREARAILASRLPCALPPLPSRARPTGRNARESGWDTSSIMITAALRWRPPALAVREPFPATRCLAPGCPCRSTRQRGKAEGNAGWTQQPYYAAKIHIYNGMTNSYKLRATSYKSCPMATAPHPARHL